MALENKGPRIPDWRLTGQRLRFTGFKYPDGHVDLQARPKCPHCPPPTTCHPADLLVYSAPHEPQ